MIFILGHFVFAMQKQSLCFASNPLVIYFLEMAVPYANLHAMLICVLHEIFSVIEIQNVQLQ